MSIRYVSWMNSLKVLQSWDVHVAKVSAECEIAGPDRCLTVKYEQLVLKPRRIMTEVLSKYANVQAIYYDCLYLNFDRLLAE